MRPSGGGPVEVAQRRRRRRSVLRQLVHELGGQRLDRARAMESRFSSYAPADGGDDAERKTSAPAKMKSRKDSLAGLTKEERLAKRKASMRAGDTWEDLHGTKDRPGREVSKARAKQLFDRAAAAGVAAPLVSEEIDWQSEPEADEGDVDIEQPAVAAGPPRRRVTIKEAENVKQRV